MLSIQKAAMFYKQAPLIEKTYSHDRILAIQRARFVEEYGLFSNVIFKNNFILHIYESLENCLYSFLFGRTRS